MWGVLMKSANKLHTGGVLQFLTCGTDQKPLSVIFQVDEDTPDPRVSQLWLAG